VSRPRVLFVGRTRYRLPLSPSLAQKFEALGRELDVRVLASAAPGSAPGDRTFALVPQFRPRRLDGLAFWFALPWRTARLVRDFRPDAVVCQTAYDAAAALLALAGSSRLAAASAAEAAGRFDAAVAEARGALRYAPWSADAWRVIGESRLAQGDRAGARDAFQSAVRLDPNGWQAWAELAEASTGEPRRAAEAEAARLNPLGSGG